MEESRLKEESEAIDQFLQSDWHMTLSKLQDRQVRKIWHECVHGRGAVGAVGH